MKSVIFISTVFLFLVVGCDLDDSVVSSPENTALSIHKAENTEVSWWTDNQTNPILVSSNTRFDFGGVSQCKILYDNSLYRMYYVGLGNNGVGNILYAESKDGVIWNKPLNKPILTPGRAGCWDSRAVGPDAVIKEGPIIKLYYRGTNENGESHVGLAISIDAKNFFKIPIPVLRSTPGSENNIGSHSLVKVNGIYYLYYAASSNTPTELKIYLATSRNGILWKRYSGNPILSRTQSWEGTGITYASVIFDKNQFKMIYQMYGSRDTAFGMATSNDGKNWVKLNTNPIFQAQNTHNGWANYDISYPFFVKVGDEYRIYYSGWSQGMYKIGFTKLRQ